MSLGYILGSIETPLRLKITGRAIDRRFPEAQEIVVQWEPLRGRVQGRDYVARQTTSSARHDGTWHGDWDQRHPHFDNGHFFVFDGGSWWGLDAGLYPWDYLPYYADDYYPYDYYTADVPGYSNGPVHNGVAVADPTVQAATQLSQAGYYGGPIDGIFGPATRDAVAKYQIAKQLDVTGSLSADTMQSLGFAKSTAS